MKQTFIWHSPPPPFIYHAHHSFIYIIHKLHITAPLIQIGIKRNHSFLGHKEITFHITYFFRFLYDDWETSIAVRASALDPSYKRLTFIEEEYKRTEVYSLLKEELRSIVVAQHDNTPPQPNAGYSGANGNTDGGTAERSSEQDEPTNALHFIQQFAGPGERSGADAPASTGTSRTDLEAKVEMAMQQFELYLTEPAVEASVNPLAWWKRGSTRFYLLLPLVKKYLCIPCSSAPVESIFSTAGFVARKRRAALTPEHVNKLVFMNRNQHLLLVEID